MLVLADSSWYVEVHTKCFRVATLNNFIHQVQYCYEVVH